MCPVINKVMALGEQNNVFKIFETDDCLSQAKE